MKTSTRSGAGVAGGLLAAALLLPAGPSGSPDTTPMAAVRNSLAGIGAPDCVSLSSNNILATKVKDLPVAKHNKDWKRASHASDRNLHPDFGPSYGAQPVPYGMPWQVVGSSHQKVRVDFTYASQSDKVQYPLGSDTPIEGGDNAGGDRHALVIDKGTCKLYETWDTHYRSGGRSRAGSGAVFRLGSNRMRPAGWTSADAAGLPIFPLLVRWDEVKSGRIDHAIRITVSRTDRRYIWPARHQAGAARDINLPPMGARARLKGSFDISGYSDNAKVVLRALKRYGVIVADNGSDWYFQGDASTQWPDRLTAQLKTIPASKFVFVKSTSLRKDRDSYAAKQP